MSWIFYVLLSTATTSITNFIEKFLVDKKVKEPLMIPIFGGILAFVFGIIILSVKGFILLQFSDLILVLLSGIFLELYLIPYFKALKVDDASRVVPLFQFIPIIVLVLGYIFLGEIITIKQLLGSILIIFGGFVLSMKKIDGKIFKLRKSLYYMFLSSFMFSIFIILFRYVAIKEDFWLIFAYENIGIGLGALLLFLLPSFQKKIIKNRRDLNLTVCALLIISDGIYLVSKAFYSYALTLTTASLVTVVGGIQPLFVLMYGLILSIWLPTIIKEDIGRKTIGIKLLTGILIFIGLYLVYF